MPIKIIAGSAKGRKLKSLPPEKTRPLLARVKKSLFDILVNKVKNATFLDLYAGTGSVGIEALSRGAKEAVFIDNDFRAVKTIEENLKQLGFEERAKILRRDVLRGLPAERKFDLIFIAPPYKLKLILPTLKVILEKEITAPEGWIICQHHFREELPEEYYNFYLFRRKKYGDMLLSFYELRAISDKKLGFTEP